MTKPIIGISGSVIIDDGGIFPGYHRSYVNEDYVDSVVQNGGVPYILPFTENDEVIREQLNRPSNFVANYRRRLLDDQIIKSTNYGEVAFTLPFFKEYVLQQHRFEQGL